MEDDSINQLAKNKMPEELKAKREARIREIQAQILEEAWKVAEKRLKSEGCGEMEVTVWDINEVFKKLPKLLDEVTQETIRENIEFGKMWLLNQKNPNGFWGWWNSSFDPPALQKDPNFSKIWSTAITLRALVRNGYSTGFSEVKEGIRWLLDNETPIGGWARLPQRYAEEYPNLCVVPNPYETSCALLTLLEAKEIVSKDDIAKVVNLIQEYQRDSGDWPLEFTQPAKKSEVADVGATAVILGALKRTNMASDQHIALGRDWLKNCQNPDGGWGFKPYSVSVTKKTCDVLRALLEVQVPPEESCIRRCALWLQKHQGPTGDNQEGWGWGTVGLNGTIIASNIENTAFVITALKRAGFSLSLPSIQAALRWVIRTRGEEAWGEDTPRVILSLHECLNETKSDQKHLDVP